MVGTRTFYDKSGRPIELQRVTVCVTREQLDWVQRQTARRTTQLRGTESRRLDLGMSAVIRRLITRAMEEVGDGEL